jgi:hypothetical protein
MTPMEPDPRELPSAFAAAEEDSRRHLHDLTSQGRSTPDCGEEIATSQDCMSKAESLRAVAKMLSDPIYRARTLEIADRWAAMAAEYEVEEAKSRIVAD